MGTENNNDRQYAIVKLNYKEFEVIKKALYSYYLKLNHRDMAIGYMNIDDSIAESKAARRIIRSLSKKKRIEEDFYQY